MMPAAVGAFPEGAPWEMTADEGCSACHFDGPVHAESEALSLEGLPDRIIPGQTYDLTLRLTDHTMEKAGFMIFFQQMSGPLGQTESESERVETQGAKARSSLAGASPETPGAARWRLRWTAPGPIDGPVRVTVWGNSANADDSPFGDRIHRKVFLAQPVR